MNKSAKLFLTPKFSHIYVERRIAGHPKTEKILKTFPQASIIYIDHYKDVFCKANQSFSMQKQSTKLILARRENSFLFKGSPLCDSFGHENFYYSTGAMNCLYNCEYCYLQGMYPSGNLVVFVNIEEYFDEICKEITGKDAYICISYDTDLLALEPMTGLVNDWIGFAAHNTSYTIEVRTKSANFGAIASKNPVNNFILAWSLSPPSVISEYEHGTPGLPARLEQIRRAVKSGWRVRLCIDPIIALKDWKDQYAMLVASIRDTVDIHHIEGISIGVFRVPEDSLKIMRKTNTESVLLAYPYAHEKKSNDMEHESWTYPVDLKNEMTNYLYKLFS